MSTREYVKLARLAVLVAAAIVLPVADGPSAGTAHPSVTLAGASQSNAPAIEYQSLLNLRYYEAHGGFLVDYLQIVFPPQGNQKLVFVITRKTGEEVARVPLRIESLREFDTFRLLQPAGVPGVIRLGQQGDFVMAVKVGDRAITTLPFSLKEEKSADPYNPKKTYVREGPWRDLAYFSSPIDNPGAPIKFNWWVSLRELPAGVSRPLCTIHVIQGGQEIAATRSPVVPGYVDWQFYKTELIQPKGLGGGWLTLAALTKRDGELTIVIKVNGQPVKSYRAEVRGGQFQRLARNQMEFEPHTDFIAPRLIDISRDGGCEYCMLDLLWVKARER
ncbi:MAG: hypothetical protein AABN33_21035 [Acidobacteriota bacterium]